MAIMNLPKRTYQHHLTAILKVYSKNGVIIVFDIDILLGLFNKIPSYQTSFQWNFHQFGPYLSNFFQFLS